MTLSEQMRLVNYFIKLLLEDRTNLVPNSNGTCKPLWQEQTSQDKLPRALPQEVGISPAQLLQFFQTLSNDRYANIHNCLVVKQGKVIAQASYAPYKAEYWSVTHSLCKTIVGLAVGFAIAEKHFTLDSKIADLLPELVSFFMSNKIKLVTIRDLLSMQSGVNFRETGSLWSTEWAKSFFRSDFKNAPGSTFEYNSMNTYMLAYIITVKTGLDLVTYLQPRLFTPLGITTFFGKKVQMLLKRLAGACT